jgi:hypothetical protein
MIKPLASIITVLLVSACGPGAGAGDGVSGDHDPAMSPASSQTTSPASSPTQNADAGKAFTLEFTARADRPAMPATLVDLSGTIIGVSPAPDARKDIDWGFAAVRDEPNVVAMGWVSSGCDTSATVTFEIREGTGWWVVQTEPGPAECGFEYRGRTMLVEFSAPPNRASFQFDMEAMGMLGP